MIPMDPARDEARERRQGPTERRSFARRIDCDEVGYGRRGYDGPARGGGQRDPELWEGRRHDPKA